MRKAWLVLAVMYIAMPSVAHATTIHQQASFFSTSLSATRCVTSALSGSCGPYS